jgi:hypothetical protein
MTRARFEPVARICARWQKQYKRKGFGLMKREPGDILRYLRNVHTPPRLKPGEILCHNHIAHLAGAESGVNGFRYFVCDGSRDMVGSFARAAGALISASTTPRPVTSSFSANASRLVSR